MLRLCSLAALLALAGPAAVPTASQEPKISNAWYEDANDLGFKIKAPKDWEFVPGSPLDRNLIGKYAAGNGQYINLGKEAFVMVQICLVKFDRREKANLKEERQLGDKTVEFSVSGKKDLAEWMSESLDEGKQWRKVEEGKPMKGALEGKVSVWEGLSNRGRPDAEALPVRAFAALFALSPEVDVALVGLGPGDKKKWRSFESAYESFGKTLQPLALKAAAKGPVGTDPRSLKRAKLLAEIERSPGWSLYETPNYFILSAYDDKGFIEELKLRLEAIRLVYEKDYPPELARKIKAKPAAPVASGTDEPAPAEGQGVDSNRSQGAIDALELGRLSVVRVCKDREQYLQYGANPTSSGYFSAMEQELVVFDDKANKGRDATWAVLNHEGFHQYTYAFFGNLAPHSWYNEGTGDYYSGFEFNTKTKRFKVEKSIGRQSNLLDIREKYAPLKEFVRWDKAQYYGNGVGKNGERLDGWAWYAQGWSLIYFLRSGEKAKGWQKPWGSILATYVDTLLETGDTEKAVDAAFSDVDWDAFEDSWRNFMM